MSDGRRIALVVLAAVVILLGVVAYGLLAVDRPEVQSVENEWGTVTEERTEVETAIAVENPLLLRLGDQAADVRYTVALNDIVFATERKERVRLSGQEDVIRVSTWLNNDKIPRWWMTHINRNQTTTVRVDPTVAVQYGDIEAPADQWTRTQTVQTNLLEPVETEEPRAISAYGRTVLVINESDAQFGTATLNRTPIDASVTVTNKLPIAIPITEISYTIRMNEIVVGEGTALRETVIPAGQTKTLNARAYIDNSKLDEWWVTHLRNNETSQLSVDLNATVEYGGVEREISLTSASYNRTFETALLGSEQSVVASDAPNALSNGVASQCSRDRTSPS